MIDDVITLEEIPLLIDDVITLGDMLLVIDDVIEFGAMLLFMELVMSLTDVTDDVMTLEGTPFAIEVMEVSGSEEGGIGGGGMASDGAPSGFRCASVCALLSSFISVASTCSNCK